MTTNIDTIAPITNKQLHHARRKKAEKLATMLDAEYPALCLFPVTDEIDRVIGWQVFHIATDDDTDGPLLYEGEAIPDLAELLEACEEMELDPEAGAEEEEPRISGSVVRDEYRQRYRDASSTKQSCGDWLAEWLTDQTYSHTDGFNVEAFTAVMVANGADMTRPWARLPETQQKGWRGRYRMNGRQTLEKLVAWNGYVIDAGGNEHQVPGGELQELRIKHAKWIAKQEKAADAADELAGKGFAAAVEADAETEAAAAK